MIGQAYYDQAVLGLRTVISSQRCFRAILVIILLGSESNKATLLANEMEKAK